MPRATVNLTPQRFPLKTLPAVGDEEGGWVQLRRMSYGELMASQDMAYQIQVSGNDDDTDAPEMGVKLTRAAIAQYQLKACVLDHNLEDEKGRKLNLADKTEVESLSAAVGQELSNLIDELHDWSKQFPNSGSPSANGSSTGRTTAEAPSSSTSTAEPELAPQPSVDTPTS